VARAFAAAGYEVHVTASRPTAPPNDSSHVHVVDLANLDAVRACADPFEEVHALVLAAGSFAASEILTLNEPDIDQMIDANWKTAVHALSAFGGKLRVGSSAVLVGSQAYEGGARMATYAASKAAVVSLAKSAALEWRQAGIRVNAVLPDTIDTPANRAAMPRADFDRWAKPDELAEVILWLWKLDPRGTVSVPGLPCWVALCLVSCGAQPPPPAFAAGEPSSQAAATPAAPRTGSDQPLPLAGSLLSDGLPVTFRAEFSDPGLGRPWNAFGVRSGYREMKGGATGLWLTIARAEKAWDAISARTATVKVDGDFDLRARFREFTASGNGSAKLLVVDAAGRGGEAAYVERIQIDGKNLVKFGGEIAGSLETWGHAPMEGKNGDLRLVREGPMLRAFVRPDDREAWNEFAPAEAAPQSMPRVLKFGVKLSAEADKSAQVRWSELTVQGQLVGAP
jgi:NAD(P)-dependent dehydrogenase (short-subunit alcohol dehydrogenase family)